jgi:CMP-N-acetylneuraminic acid synthetase
MLHKKKTIFTKKNKYVLIQDRFENIDIDTKQDYEFNKAICRKF